MIHPARCPGCGAIIESHLATMPDVPVYLCGSTPIRLVCVARELDDRRADHVDHLHNVMQPTYGELESLADLVAAADAYYGQVGVSWSTRRRIGLCSEPGCDATAIDGWCIAHDEQIVEAVAQARRAELGIVDVYNLTSADGGHNDR